MATLATNESGWDLEEKSAMRTVDVLIWSIVFGLIYIGIVGILRFVRGDAEMHQGSQWMMLIVQGLLLTVGIFGSYRMLRKFQKRRDRPYYGWWTIFRDFLGMFLSILSFWLPLRLAMKHLFSIQHLPGQFWMGLIVSCGFIGLIMLVRWRDERERESNPFHEKWGLWINPIP